MLKYFDEGSNLEFVLDEDNIYVQHIKRPSINSSFSYQDINQIQIIRSNYKKYKYFACRIYTNSGKVHEIGYYKRPFLFFTDGEKTTNYIDFISALHEQSILKNDKIVFKRGSTYSLIALIVSVFTPLIILFILLPFNERMFFIISMFFTFIFVYDSYNSYPKSYKAQNYKRQNYFVP